MIRFIKIVLFLIVGLLSASAQGQQVGRSSDKSFFHYPDAQFNRQQLVQKVTRVGEAFQQEAVPQCDPADTMSVALYRSTVKQHGWMRGQGLPITEEVANHLSSYYRFSKKNKAGHWTKMECLNAYGRPSGCGSTYLINPYDDDDKQLDENWREKLKEIVYWEFVGDNTGENCVQENAYNKEGELILSYTSVRVGENKYMGHYVDAWGLPAKMRDEQGAKYVVIQRDENGYEYDVSFIGDDGFYKHNNWGAYRSKYFHDKKGFLIQHMSANVDGDFMLDRAGNSGQLNTYDEKGWLKSITNVDEYGKIMRIELNETADKDYIRKNYEYDEWGRDTCQRYFLADGITPDTITGGVHAQRYQYDSKGNCTLIQCLGLDGKPITDNRGFSMAHREYDEYGNEILYECRNAKGDYFNNTACLVYYTYHDNMLIEQKRYQTSNGQDTLLTYHFVRNGNTRIYEYPDDDWREVYVYDDDDNQIGRIYSMMDGTPQNCANGYHQMKMTYTHKPGRCIIEESYWDKAGRLADLRDPTFREYISDDNPYNRHVTTVDSIRGIKTFQRFDNNTLLFQFQQVLTNDFKVRTGERSLDALGHAARSHYGHGLYYDATTGHTVKGGFSAAYISITNEYGEVGYRMSSDGNTPTIYAFDPYGETFFVDEHGDKIDDQSSLRNTLPRACIIEVYDSVAVGLGIQSGDVIMEFGHWNYPELRNSNIPDWNLREATFELRDQKKRMVVMRRNPDTNQAEVKEIMLGKGTLNDFGFYFYRIYCTQKEKARYDETYRTWQASQPPTKQKKEKALKPDTYPTQFMSPLRSDGNNKNIFGRGTIDDAIVLALAVQDKRGHIHTFLHTDSIEVFDSCRFVKDRTIQKIWFTTDMYTVRSLDLTGKDSYWDARFWYETKDKRISKPCKPLYQEADSQMKQYVHQLQAAYRDSMQALYDDAWQAVEDDSIIIRVAKVNADDGYMVRQGYKDRLFVVLEWCDWTCLDAPETFSPIIDKYRYEPKHVVLLGVETKDDIDVFTDVVEIDSDSSMLGVGTWSIKLSYQYFKKNILNKYKDWKSGNNRQLPLEYNGNGWASL